MLLYSNGQDRRCLYIVGQVLKIAYCWSKLKIFNTKLYKFVTRELKVDKTKGVHQEAVVISEMRTLPWQVVKHMFNRYTYPRM
jgi:hypothetical protein